MIFDYFIYIFIIFIYFFCLLITQELLMEHSTWALKMDLWDQNLRSESVWTHVSSSTACSKRSCQIQIKAWGYTCRGKVVYREAPRFPLDLDLGPCVKRPSVTDLQKITFNLGFVGIFIARCCVCHIFCWNFWWNSNTFPPCVF